MNPDNRPDIDYSEQVDEAALQRRRLIILIVVVVGVVGSIAWAAIFFAHAAIPPERKGETDLEIPVSDFARVVAVEGVVKRMRISNRGWEFINVSNMESLRLREGDKLSVSGNQSYIVFGLDEKTRFLLRGDNASLTFKVFNKADEIILEHDAGELQGNVDETQGYNILIIDPSRVEYRITGTEFTLRATRRRSSVSVASGSISVNRSGMSSFSTSEIVKSGNEIESIAGRLGRASKIADISRAQIDSILKKSKEEIEKERPRSKEEKELEWENAITNVLYAWAEKGITERGTTTNRLYTEPPGFTTDRIKLIMGCYVGRVWGEAANIEVKDIPGLDVLRERRFEYTPEPGNRTYEKILDRLFVRSGVKEARLVLKTKKKIRGTVQADKIALKGRLSAEEIARLEEEARKRAEQELVGNLLRERNHVVFRINAGEKLVRAAVFHGVLQIHDSTAGEESENYSVPAGTAFAYWIEKPDPDIPTYEPQYLRTDDFLVYAGLMEQFWKFSTDAAKPDSGEEIAKKARRGLEDIEERKSAEYQTLWEEETRQGVDIEFIRGGLFALVNFNMDVRFEAREGRTLPQRVYPCFMLFMRDPETDGRKAENWKAFMGGYRTFCSGEYGPPLRAEEAIR